METDQASGEAGADSVRPQVGRPANNRAVWIFSAVILAVAIGLFAGLEARRSTISSPSISAVPDTTNAMFAAPPELAIPPEFPQRFGSTLQMPVSAPQAAGVQFQPPVLQHEEVAVVRPRAVAVSSPLPPLYLPAGSVPSGNLQTAPAPSPAFAYQAPQRGPAPGQLATDSAKADERAIASKLLNPATTVPQGTVIQAVLETALDSNRAGFARAVVSRDVSGFDGSRVLIPKGSKLFGEYKADLTLGQGRALIQWRRLTRPDGTIIDVDSPSADPLGRAGLKGKVNSHFFARFGGTILQSALDIGTQIAARQASGSTYVLALPNSAQNLQNLAPNRPEDVRPTLTIRQGTSVSVFVGRDLDFTGVE